MIKALVFALAWVAALFGLWAYLAFGTELKASTLPLNIAEAMGQADDALFTSADYAQATD